MGKGLKALFEPIQVGNMLLRNRIKLPAMAVTMGADEYVSDQMKAFYAERAKGGVALIGISCTATRLMDDPMKGLYDDRFIPGLREVVDAIHEHGAKAYAQMGVGYCWAFGDGPVEVVSPSGINITGKPGTPFRMGGPYEPTMPRELTRDEIHQMISAYGDGALRAKKAGFDAVEIIASVGYVISQFMSPLTNKRTDEYGGSLENRMRLFLEIVEDIKGKAGKDFPITTRISGDDLLEPKGYGLEDSKKMARMMEEAGVCEIDVMAGWHYTSVPVVQTPVPQGRWVFLAEGIKAAVTIPVAAGNQIQDFRVAERVVAERRADMVWMARALIADPEAPNKARQGRLKEIRPCMNCCRCLEDSDNPPVYCSVNARMGREAEYPFERLSPVNKKVLVVGGGPGGMEAARIASLRGHRVTLCEQSPRLGGALLLASITNWRLGPVLRWMTREIKRLPIEVKLGTTVTPEMIEKMNPDVVVVAAGGAAPPLGVPGADSEILLDRRDVQAVFGGGSVPKGGISRRVISFFAGLFIRFFYDPDLLRWLLRFDFPFKKRVAILGGNYPGCELGETLLSRGKEVAIIEESGRIGADIGMMHRWLFIKALREGGAKLITSAKVLEITDRGVKIERAGSQELVEADTVVKVGITKNLDLAEGLKAKVPVVYLVGDCTDPGMLMEAVASGFLVGQKV